MANQTRTARVLKALAFSYGTFFVLCLIFGSMYAAIAKGACGQASSACACQPAPSLWPNGVYYAAQTITTTGYGTGVAVHLEAVQSFSVFLMPVTAMFWGVVIAGVYEAFKK